MDFFKRVLEESNRQYLEDLASVKFPIDDEDTLDEQAYLRCLRETFMKTYHKHNNRQLALTKDYHFIRYRKEADRYERTYDIHQPQRVHKSRV